MPFQLIKPGTHIDFIGKRHIAGLCSGGLLVASAVALFVQGPRLGIDFAGGTELQIRFEAAVPADEGRVRSVMHDGLGIEDPAVVRYGEPGDNEFLVKFLENINPDPTAIEAGADDRIEEIDAALTEAIGPVEIERVEFVGPRVGSELRADGLKSLFWASVVILGYITIRFSSRFAPGAIVAVLHDIAITAGIFVIFGVEFDLRILAAMLAIMGYSLNDTIIIYDRIRENMQLHTTVDLPEVLNSSVNQTLSRTVLTSATTLVALVALYALGGRMIQPFAMAMIIGVVVGTYSSVFIAAPTLLLLERRFARAG